MTINHEVPPPYEGLDGMDLSDAQFWRERDIEENRDSTPPEGEAIGRPVMKVAECFVGGDIQALVDGCRALGIAPADNLIRTSDVYTWVDQVRRTSRTGSWVDIGAGHTRAQERAWADDIAMNLPPDFERVVLKAFSPTPSIVFLVATFVLTPEAAAGVDDELHTNRFLRLEKRGRFTSFASAVHRKGDAVRAERARIIEAASIWVAQTFAGTLSRDFTSTTLPSIEFLTTQINEPFTDPQPSGRAGRSDYTTLLSIDSAFDAWETAEARGWRLGMAWRDSDAPWTIVAACRVSATETDDSNEIGDGANEPDTDNSQRGPDPHPSKTYDLGWSFDGILIRFAAYYLLVQYERAFGELRDQLATSETQRTALETLDATHTTLTTLSFDASLVANELKRWASDDSKWRHDCIEPKTATPWKQELEPDYPPLLKILADNLNERGDWILDLEPRIRDQLVSRTSILAVSADLRLQRIVLTISVIALLIATISLISQ